MHPLVSSAQSCTAASGLCRAPPRGLPLTLPPAPAPAPALQSLPVLTALTELLRAEFGYTPGRELLRLEGSVSAVQRSRMIAAFNKPGSRAKVGRCSRQLIAAHRVLLAGLFVD